MSVAKAYAKALFEAAVEGKSQADLAKTCDEIEAQLNQFVAITTASKEANIALTSPVTTSKEKSTVVQSIAAKAGLLPVVSRFLSLLASKGRMDLISEVRDYFSEIRLAAEGGVSGKLVSAEAMSSADVDQLAAAFSKKLGRKVAFRVSTDPSLLAGVRVVVNGVTYDGTLRSQLEQLRNKLATGTALV